MNGEVSDLMSQNRELVINYMQLNITSGYIHFILMVRISLARQTGLARETR